MVFKKPDAFFLGAGGACLYTYLYVHFSLQPIVILQSDLLVFVVLVFSLQ
jgi:hypothetical protein